MDILMQTMRKEGILALYKGSRFRALRIQSIHRSNQLLN